MKFRHTNFMRLIYATLLALPFVAILSRVIYVQSNKNAYQSAEITQTTYSRSTKYTQGDINNGLEEGKIYHLSTSENESPSNLFEGYMQIQIINGYLNIKSSAQATDDLASDVLPLTYHVISFDSYEECIYYYDYNEKDGVSYFGIALESVIFYDNEIDFLLLSIDVADLYDCISNTTYQEYEYNEVESTTLDNVFEYSVNKFIENNNFGKINLFQWTTDLFFDSNDVNNMYVGFINWYLNYTLLVSATYILFLVLMWFINYARRLLERGMNYDF